MSFSKLLTHIRAKNKNKRLSIKHQKGGKLEKSGELVKKGSLQKKGVKQSKKGM